MKTASVLIGFLAMTKVSAFAPSPLIASRYNPEHVEQDQGVRVRTRWERREKNFPPQTKLRIVPLEMLQLPQVVISTTEQNIQAQIFADLAHIILDFATVFSPDTIVLRLFVLCGRAFSILSDFIPDGEMTPDELLFQASMFTLSSNNLVKKCVPLLRSCNQTASFRDRRLYQNVFSQAGFSLAQYTSLLANGALEWVEIPPRSIHLENEDNLLVSYRGIVFHPGNGNDNAIYGKRNGRRHHDFIGNLSAAAKKLTDEGLKKRSAEARKKRSLLRVQTGSIEATLLRINTRRLLEAVSEDDVIAECVKNLYFNAIQDKLTYYEPAGSQVVNTPDSDPTFDTAPNGTKISDYKLTL